MFDWSDPVVWGSVASVGICLVIIIYVGIMAMKKINTDHSDD
jgi:hypothetical protein